MILLFSCCNNKNPNETWVERVYCKDVNSKVEFKKIYLNKNNYLVIHFCRPIGQYLKIVLDKGDKRYYYLQNTSEINLEKIILDEDYKKYFKRDMEQLKLNDGIYSLSLWSENSCGMITFSIHGESIVDEELLCSLKCR